MKNMKKVSLYPLPPPLKNSRNRNITIINGNINFLRKLYRSYVILNQYQIICKISPRWKFSDKSDIPPKNPQNHVLVKNFIGGC